MKKTLLLLFALISGGFTTASFATGIPVVDAAALAQALQSYQQLQQEVQLAQQQYDQLTNQLDEMKNFNKNITGNWSLQSLFSNNTLNNVLPQDWTSMYSSNPGSGLRGQYGLITSNPVKQTLYDTQLSTVSNLTRLYDAAVQRTANIEQLEALQDSAQTEQQKLDYANKLAYEQTQLANEQTKIQVTQALSKEQESLAHKTATQNVMNQFWR